MPGSGSPTEEDAPPRSKRRRNNNIGYVVVLLGFILGRWQISNTDADHAFADTLGYARVSETGLGSRLFWGGERPFTVPLIYQALGLEAKDPPDQQAMRRVTSFQIGLSVLSWISLATAVAWATQGRWSRLAAFGLILAFATSLDITQWDRILLSESVSSSIFAEIVGGSILGVQLWAPETGGPDRLWQILFVAYMSLLVVFFAFARDSNGYIVLAVSIGLAGSVCLPAVRTRPVAPIAGILALIMAGTFCFQDRSTNLGKRWLGPFLNVFSARILPVEEFVEFFSDRGFPAEAITEEMYLGRPVFLSQLQQTQEGGRLLEWIEKNGKSTYLQFLASRPAQTLGKPIQRAGSMVNVDSSEYRLRERPDPAWAVLISDLMFPTRTEFLLGFALLAPVVLLSTKNRLRTFQLTVTGLALMVVSYPLAVVIWHADTIELERHSYQLALQVRLAAWLLVIGAMPSLSDLVARVTHTRLVTET